MAHKHQASFSQRRTYVHNNTDNRCYLSSVHKGCCVILNWIINCWYSISVNGYCRIVFYKFPAFYLTLMFWCWLITSSDIMHVYSQVIKFIVRLLVWINVNSLYLLRRSYSTETIDGEVRLYLKRLKRSNELLRINDQYICDVAWNIILKFRNENANARFIILRSDENKQAFIKKMFFAGKQF